MEFNAGLMEFNAGLMEFNAPSLGNFWGFFGDLLNFLEEFLGNCLGVGQGLPRRICRLSGLRIPGCALPGIPKGT